MCLYVLKVFDNIICTIFSYKDNVMYEVAVFLLLWVSKRSGVWVKAPIIRMIENQIIIIEFIARNNGVYYA